VTRADGGKAKNGAAFAYLKLIAEYLRLGVRRDEIQAVLSGYLAGKPRDADELGEKLACVRRELDALVDLSRLRDDVEAT
jgi:hypothetical protein